MTLPSGLTGTCAGCDVIAAAAVAALRDGCST